MSYAKLGMNRFAPMQFSPGGSFGSVSGDIEAELRARADARVANALAMIQNDPAAKAALDKVSQVIFDIGKKALDPFIEKAKQFAIEQIQSFASSISPAVAEAFSGLSSVAGSIASNLSAMLPIINAIISVWNGVAAQYAAESAMKSAQKCAGSRNVGIPKSGLEGTLVGSDIFLPGGQDIVPEIVFPGMDSTEKNLYPFSSLGRAFVGIFEWRSDYTMQDSPPKDCYTDLECSIVGDHPQYHTRAAYKRLSKWYRENTVEGKTEVNAGKMPEERMKLMKALRLAMSARSSISPMLFVVYLDLVKDAFKQGWVTGGWADFMMSHKVWPSDKEGNLVVHGGEYKNAKRSQVVVNPPSTWGNDFVAVLPDVGFSVESGEAKSIAEMTIAGAYPPWTLDGSQCGVAQKAGDGRGWQPLVDSILNIAYSTVEVDQKELDSEIDKAKKALSFIKVGKTGLSIPKDLLLSMAKKVSKGAQEKKVKLVRASLKSGVPRFVSTKDSGIPTGALVMGIAGAGLLGFMLLKKKR